MENKKNKGTGYKAESLIDNQGWDEYWDVKDKKSGGNRLYDIIAEFYRKFIIRPTLNRFVKKYFAPESKILHAGCGSGQVDKDIRNYVSITGMDISKNALLIFEKENKDYCKSLHGSVFDIPISSASIAGVYNLGVMEHFDEAQIQKILAEFHRILEEKGKIILFWPPEFGLSVMFFKVLRVILMPFFGKKIKFHPDEICRIKSKKHAYNIIEKANFRVVEYYFGISDLFTYSVIVAEKNT